MNEKTFAVLTITIITLSFSCGLLLYLTNDIQNQSSVSEEQIIDYQNQIAQLENQIDELENQTGELETQVDQDVLSSIPDSRLVKIKEVEWGEQWNSSMEDSFYVDVTVKNYGPNDVDELAILCRHALDYNETETVPIGLIKAESEKTFTIRHYYDISYAYNYTVTLMRGDTILDEEQFWLFI